MIFMTARKLKHIQKNDSMNSLGKRKEAADKGGFPSFLCKDLLLSWQFDGVKRVQPCTFRRSILGDEPFGYLAAPPQIKTVVYTVVF